MRSKSSTEGDAPKGFRPARQLPLGIYLWDDGRTDAEVYLTDVLDGKVVAGRRLKQLADVILPRITDGYKGWHFDVDKAIRPIRFAERFCLIPAGDKANMPFHVATFQRCAIELAFGFVDDDGYRQVHEVIMEMARKCGKTTMLAFLNSYMLTSDGPEYGAEIYNIATTDAQARLCYGATNTMMETSPLLSKHIRRGMVQKRGMSGLNYDKTHSYLVTLNSKSSTKAGDGLNAHFAVMDELAACEDGGTSYDIITESMSARKQPLLWVISTENYVRNNIWDERKKYAYGWLDGDVEDDRFLPILYEMDDREEIYDESMWPKANPGLGIMKEWQAIRDAMTKAAQSPARMPSLLTKHFNLPSNSYASFFTINECINRELYPITPDKFTYCIIGFDLADKGDLNAAVALFMRETDDDGNPDNRIYERSMFWIAEEQVKINSNSFKERDAVPYHQWAADGHLRIVPGNKVNQQVVVEWITELVDEGFYPFACGYDQWHVDDRTEMSLQRLVGESRVKPVKQWPRDISPLMKEHRLDLRAKRIVDNDNPILEWCRSNVQARCDNNDNYFPQKKELKASRRIDGYMAELCAYGALKRHEEEYMQVITW